MFLAILVLALQSGYWISPGSKKKVLCNLILFGISSDLSCGVRVYVLFVHVTMGFPVHELQVFFLINESLLYVKTTVMWKF